MRISVAFVLFILIQFEGRTAILNFVEDDSPIFSLLSLLQSRFEPHERLQFHKFKPKNSEEFLSLSNRTGVVLSLFYRSSEPGLPIILTAPDQSSSLLDTEKVQFARKILKRLIEILGEKETVHLGHIPYAETTYLSSPYIVVRVPTDLDLEKFSTKLATFFTEIFPDHIQITKPQEVAAQPSKSKPREEGNWFFQEESNPFYTSRDLQERDEERNLLENFQRKGNIEDPLSAFEEETDASSWGLQNPLQSLFSSRSSPKLSTPRVEDVPEPIAVEETQPGLLSAFFSQDGIHLNPPERNQSRSVEGSEPPLPEPTTENSLRTNPGDRDSEQSEITNQEPQPQNSSSQLVSMIENSIGLSPPMTPTEHLSVLDSIESLVSQIESTSSQQGLTTFASISRSGSSIRTTGVSTVTTASLLSNLTGSSLPSQPASSTQSPLQTSRAKGVRGSNNLENLYFLQAPWDRPQAPAHPTTSDGLDPIPEYLKP